MLTAGRARRHLCSDTSCRAPIICAGKQMAFIMLRYDGTKKA